MANNNEHRSAPRYITDQVVAPIIVAYNLASFWYCVEHGEVLQDAHPEPAENLLPQYEYRCDNCGKLIREQLV